jgi:hypothetical protein
LQAYEVNEPLGDDLPWWAKVASFIPELSAAVPGGEAIGSCAAALVLGFQGY